MSHPRLTAILAAAIIGSTSAITAEGAYTLDLSGGTLPAGVSAANATGQLPQASGYKRGYTTDGWCVDRYADRGYVALSPTFTASPTPCSNILRLPAIDIAEGEFLSWQALSADPYRPESYRVEASIDQTDSIITLAEIESEADQWTPHMVDLSQWRGHQLHISFICTSTNRYLLALTEVRTGVPQGLSFHVADLSQVFSGSEAAEAGATDYPLRMLNTGAPLSAGRITLSTPEGEYSAIGIEEQWASGEWRSITLPAPASLNTATPCTIAYEDGDTRLPLTAKTLWCSHFKRHAVVDEATGMWCVNCPEGNLELEALQHTYGDDISIISTHVRDPLANDDYYNALGFRSIPRMKLNRIEASASADASGFSDYLFTPVIAEVQLMPATLSADGRKASIEAHVRTAEPLDNSTDRYRIGYVLTASFNGGANADGWYQKNNCTQPSDARYYYLPSTILGELARFDHTSLTFDGAFDGLAASLPATLQPGEEYTARWEVTAPELLQDIAEGRIVAYILDTDSGEILNGAEISLSPDAPSGVVDIESDRAHGCHTICRLTAPDRLLLLNPDSEGHPTTYCIDAFDLQGGHELSLDGTLASSCEVRLPLSRGIHILRVSIGGTLPQTTSMKINS